MQEQDEVDALFTPPAETPETVAAPVEAPAPEPVVEAPAAETPLVSQPSPEPAPEPVKTEHTVPLPKYLDVRDELKEAKRKVAEYEAKQQAAKAPDPIDDPAGFQASIRGEFQRELTAKTFQMSDLMARQAHGAEKVESATEWALKRAQEDPVFAAQYMRETHPIDWIVRQHQRDSLVSQLPSDITSLDELKARWIAEQGQSAPPVAAAPAAAAIAPPATTAAPPRSIASDTPSSTTAPASDPNADFLAIFAKG